jgi:hypothetical protein
MSPLLLPYQDAFETGVLGIPEISQGSPPKNFNQLEGGTLVAADGTFLGKISRNRYDAESISNKYGVHGSRYASASILNPYSNYGSRYSNLSPNNPYTSTPPRLIKGGMDLGVLTVNPYLPRRVDTRELLQWLGVD